ncbi:MAG TPA: 5-formyltetrahydrofolate cyclo-ligase [Candidatus Accumulibacter phosphatis]|nr:MAG: putative 5-formyltetrahydrofolate cyclo-ligase [Candidatus Accumulibacter sp. SK-11]HAY28749.1 5-formyltetrahydrofolate cyclo-ligase [Accumulibacter sp.]HRL74863.1 5-formyltetrahydrofolate cyclo-ligase [Candidatus Accumulibacter phosphatis]HCN68918.1 5-formyltetrahydrofolate cyclo-ligase [Accumulibacter sp.]HCV12910.1 5-formyltetrahydrofolate cyclo-ligase [Accumulibacter sp.]
MASGLMPGSGTGDRRVLRRSLLARRRALPADEWLQHSQVIRGLLQESLPRLAALRVGFCWPHDNEPDLRPLIAHWQRQGDPRFMALLPVVLASDTGLAFRAWSPGLAMTTDRYGIPVPASGELVLPQALLIPLVGFDAAGFRLGYGGGYFDRTLASLRPRPLAIGVGFELSRLDSVLPEPHDQPLDLIVTEAGVCRCPATITQGPPEFT